MKWVVAFLILCAAAAVAQPSFPTNVVVLPQTNGSVTVQWTASPATNVHHVVYIGVAAGVYNVSVTVSNGSVATVSNLAAGFTYFFRVRAKDRTSGVESDPSNEVSYQVMRPEAPSGLRTATYTPVLESAPYPEGPWRVVESWETKTVLADADRRFVRFRVETGRGTLGRRL